MKRILINRLFESISELENAISSARVTLSSNKKQTEPLLGRIEVYQDILSKQRNLATALCGHAALGNWNEVSRHVKLINELSYLIRDDAREVLGNAFTPMDQDHHDVMYC